MDMINNVISVLRDGGIGSQAGATVNNNNNDDNNNNNNKNKNNK